MSRNIVHVVGRLSRSWGGLSLFVAQLAEQQAASGHRVTVLCEAESVEDPDWPHGSAKPNSASPRSPDWKRILGESDIIHVHGLWLWRYHQALADARRLQKPHVLSIHGMLESGALAFSRWRKRLAWWLYQRKDVAGAPLIHVTAEPELQSVRSHGFDQTVVTIPPGVHLPEARSALPASPGGCKPSGERVALFLGRLHQMKGLDELLDAWAGVKPVGWRLEIGGPDEAGLTPGLKAKARRLGISGAIGWLGPVFGEEKEQALDRAELLLVPSRSENFGIIVAEGLAHSLPVLTTTGTPWRQVKERDCGWWVDCQVEALADALKEATGKSSEELGQMGLRGREWAAEDFIWEALETRMDAAYGHLIRENRDESLLAKRPT